MWNTLQGGWRRSHVERSLGVRLFIFASTLGDSTKNKIIPMSSIHPCFSSSPHAPYSQARIVWPQKTWELEWHQARTSPTSRPLWEHQGVDTSHFCTQRLLHFPLPLLLHRALLIEPLRPLPASHFTKIHSRLTAHGRDMASVSQKESVL